MPSIDRQEVERVANLARLTLSEEEKESFSTELSDILASAVALNEVPTEGVEPTAHVVPIQNVLRADRSRPSLPKEKALGNAPQVQDGYFRVPTILEE